MTDLDVVQLSWLYQGSLKDILQNSLYEETAFVYNSDLMHSTYLESVILAGIQDKKSPDFKVFITTEIDSLFEIQQETIFRKDLIVKISKTVLTEDILSEILAVLVDQITSFY